MWNHQKHQKKSPEKQTIWGQNILNFLNLN